MSPSPENPPCGLTPAMAFTTALLTTRPRVWIKPVFSSGTTASLPASPIMAIVGLSTIPPRARRGRLTYPIPPRDTPGILLIMPITPLIMPMKPLTTFSIVPRTPLTALLKAPPTALPTFCPALTNML
ncbi:Uncharacterised protein [Streptococcus pneumoniae]|nr:Uncharacterised protein [Streptococcus pneumoniae]COK80781.1 Uncharacterised protein [Streptococcus pneumoniae]